MKELINRLRRYKYHLLTDPAYSKSDIINDAEKAADAIENLVNQAQWTPVTEGLPENDYGKHWKDRKYYLVLYQPSGLMCVAHYGYKQYDWWIDNHDCVMSATNYKEVTHWMPLPQPPLVDEYGS